jgi:hypothetical protein
MSNITANRISVLFKLYDVILLDENKAEPNKF